MAIAWCNFIDNQELTILTVFDMQLGVGFEDCSARVTMTKESEFRNSSYTAWHIHLPGGYWDYYAFNVSSTDYHIVARAILEAGSEGWQHKLYSLNSEMHCLVQSSRYNFAKLLH